MKAVVIIVLAVAVMAYAGWVTFTYHNNTASVTVNQDKIKADTDAMVHRADATVRSVGEPSSN